MSFSLNSPSFKNGERIPVLYTCDGKNISPAMSWINPPKAAKSFALIVDDLDAPSGEFIHWILFNIPKSTTHLSEGVPNKATLEDGAMQCRTSSNRLGYSGPCPPPGPAHNYRFRIFALDRMLVDLQAGVSKESIMDAIGNSVLGKAELTGIYSR
jgi:Raf kinase inhibitor-like YbhB/YbcL family protein